MVYRITRSYCCEPQVRSIIVADSPEEASKKLDDEVGLKFDGAVDRQEIEQLEEWGKDED
jgi:hypothetical protein